MSDSKLVVIFLRGGADSLSLVAPSADPHYIDARPASLRVGKGTDVAGIPLGPALADVDFRLHDAAGDLGTLFKAGDLSIVHATGLGEATRSHFDAEARIERASDDLATGGWLGRTLRLLPGGAPLPALAVGTTLPESLRGGGAAVAPDLSELVMASGHWLAPALRARMQAGFGSHGSLGATVSEILALSRTLEERYWHEAEDVFAAYAPAVEYPDTPLSASLKTVARSMKADLGLRIATVDYGGWDTHAHQAADFPALLGGLSASLMAFWRDLGPLQSETSVVVMSEFGRRLRSNASGGTDHGRAGAMMVLGPQARGGRLLGRWPGLANEALEEGADLAVTTDYRAVLAEVLSGHMGIADTGEVFPGLVPTAVGLFG
ncbi:MAG: DUF1501 domain-containing protein [Rhodobacteraceae bacterium]|nr:DUF1501 domain-containing protein [Paracoccaceae bacterium]